MKISIITPTFNRQALLERLYLSLKNQTNKNFEWLVIDDGSTDSTKNLINKFIDENKLDISYFYKNNGGKHTALNYAFQKSQGSWCVVVDSDDWLEKDFIEVLNQEILNTPLHYGAISLLKKYSNGRIIGDKFPLKMKTYIDRLILDIQGDKIDIIRTDIIRQFHFPEFKNEKFMAEDPLFIFIGTNYQTKFVNYAGYICDYQQDGLSANSIKNRYESISSTLFVYYNRYSKLDNFKLKTLAAINWWRFYLQKRIEVKNKPNLFFLPLGWALHLKDKVNILLCEYNTKKYSKN